MRVLDSIPEPALGLPFPVVTLGNFDGVHLGHRHLVSRVLQVARAHAGTAVVITFEPHPITLLRPDLAPPRICSDTEKRRRLAALGVDVLVRLSFDHALSQMSAEGFAKTVLVEGLGTRHFVAGPDSRFGRGRAGDAAFLTHFGVFSVESVPALMHQSEPVSSSRIRSLVQSQGDVIRAAQLLGHPITMSGEVVAGDQRGRTIGVPTANLAVCGQLCPADGVYAAWATLPDGGRHPAVVNIGVRPTFGVLARTVEAHLLDFEADLYGQRLTLEWVARIRAERRFGGVEDLKNQIHDDIRTARGHLG